MAAAARKQAEAVDLSILITVCCLVKGKGMVGSECKCERSVKQHNIDYSHDYEDMI